MTPADAEAKAREIHDMILPVQHHATMDGHASCQKCQKIAAALLAAAAEEREALREVAEAAIYTSSKTTYDDVREALLRQDKIVKVYLATLAAKEGK